MPLSLSSLVIVLGHLGTNVVHVKSLDLTDQIIEGWRGESTGLGVENDLVTEDHQRGNRPDPELIGKFLLILGVDLGKDNVFVFLGSRFERGGEHAAGSTPFGPEIDDDSVIVLDRLVERLFSQSDSGHLQNLSWQSDLGIEPALDRRLFLYRFDASRVHMSSNR